MEGDFSSSFSVIVAEMVSSAGNMERNYKNIKEEWHRYL